MLNFNEPRLEDKAQADSILNGLSYRLCEYCFGDLFLWRKIYNTEIAFFKGFLFVRFMQGGRRFYLYPAGEGDREEALRLVFETAKGEDADFCLACVTEKMRGEIERIFPEKFLYTPVRDSFDYIYNAQDLITLSGRKYHSKRNHVARFERQDNWRYDEITPENIGLCEEMNDEWCKINGCARDLSLKSEYCAVRQAFRNYSALGLTGGMITLNGRVVAFSIGQKLCSDTFIVHIEKAFSDVEGAYSIINREFATHNCGGYAYINREDDAGDEGLRKSKLSYRPAILLEKYSAVLTGGETL